MRAIPLALCIATGLSVPAWAGDGHGHGHDDGPDPCDWSQWGRTAGHDGRACAKAQDLDQILAQEILDPFVDDDGDPIIGSRDHLQVPLLDDATPSARAASRRGACSSSGRRSPPTRQRAVDRAGRVYGLDNGKLFVVGR